MTENKDFFPENETAEDEELFYERADEFIALANQLSDGSHANPRLTANAGNISASFMFSNARYSVWNAACVYSNVADFKADREQILNYYLEQFKSLLENNLDEYEENFETYFPQDEDDDTKPSFS